VAAPIVPALHGSPAGVAGAADRTGVDGTTSIPIRYIRMLMFDGASLEVILSSVAPAASPISRASSTKDPYCTSRRCGRRRPNRCGARLRPGRYPMSNGRAIGGRLSRARRYADPVAARLLLHAGARDVWFLSEQQQTANDLLARPIWNILSDRGASVGVCWLAVDATGAGRERPLSSATRFIDCRKPS
jgi:hypothetical protein